VARKQGSPSEVEERWEGIEPVLWVPLKRDHQRCSKYDQVGRQERVHQDSSLDGDK